MKITDEIREQMTEIINREHSFDSIIELSLVIAKKQRSRRSSVWVTVLWLYDVTLKLSFAVKAF